MENYFNYNIFIYFEGISFTKLENIIMKNEHISENQLDELLAELNELNHNIKDLLRNNNKIILLSSCIFTL